MALPTAGDVYVSAPLTNISVAYMQKPSAFIADRVFPRVGVTKQGGKYYTYPKTYWLRDEMEIRVPGTESAGGGWTVDSSPTYYCDVWAEHKDIDDNTRTNSDAVIDMDRDATNYLAQKALLKKEVEWVSHFFTTGLWAGSSGSTDITGVSGVPADNQVKQWSDVSSTPIDDVEMGRISMVEQTGYMPNTLVLGPRVFKTLKNHPDVLDRIKYTSRDVVTAEILAKLFEVDQVLIPYATKNTGAEGGTAAYSLLYGKHALLCYAAPAPSLLEPSAGYTITWTGLLGGSALGSRMKKFRMEHLESDRVEIEMAFQQKLVASDCGCFYTSIVA